MSQHRKPTHLHSPILTACAAIMAAGVTIAIPTAAFADGPGHESHDAKPHATGSMDHHAATGMPHMEGMSMTGDADYDFAANMRKHHQMAVDMSEAQLKDGKNPEMLKMAKDIISAQKKEIAVLDQWIAAHGKPAAAMKPK